MAPRPWWERNITRGGLLASLGISGWFAADAITKPSPIRRICSTVYSTITQTVPAPPPPPPVALGTSLYAFLPASSGTTFYVTTTGSDSTGDGSVGNPWASFQKLLDNLTAGQRGEMAAGTYDAPTGNGHVLANGHSGTALNPIEVYAATPGSVVLRPTVASPHETFRIASGVTASSYWRFRGLIFEEAGTGSNYQNIYVAGTSNGCHDVEFWNCTSREANEGSGMLVEEACANIYFMNCDFHDNHPRLTSPFQGHGAYVTGDNCMMLNCKFHDHTAGNGIQVRTNAADGPSGVIVANCVAYNNRTPDTHTIAGFWAETEQDGCQYWNNISYANATDSTGDANGFFGSNTGSVPSTANICRKNIANANPDFQFKNSSGVNWVFDFDGAGDHTGPGDNLTSNPLLVNPAGGDFHLQAGSPAIGYGNEAYCPTFDFDMVTRSQCDAGVYRFGTAAAETFMVEHRLGFTGR